MDGIKSHIGDDDRIREASATERSGWEFLAGRSVTTQSEYTKHMEITARTAQRHLSNFEKLGLMRILARCSSN